MKKLLIILLTLSLIFCFAACASNDTATEPDEEETAATEESEDTGDTTEAVSYDEVTWNMSVSGTETGIDAYGATTFAELVEERSDGAVQVTVYPSAQLASGNMAGQMELFVQGGAFEAACLSDPVIAVVCNEADAWGIPFLFDSYDDVYACMDGSGGEWMNSILNEVGITYLGGLSNGLVHITDNKYQIVEPSDIAGLKFRVYGTIQESMINALGGDPIQMNWGEVYTAMQQGTIDGHMNGWMSIYSGHVYEVQEYITAANINWGGFFLMVRSDELSSLNEATQELIKECAYEAGVAAREYLDEKETSIKEEITASGCSIYTLTDEERQAFKDALADVIGNIAANYSEETLTALGL